MYSFTSEVDQSIPILLSFREIFRARERSFLLVVMLYINPATLLKRRSTSIFHSTSTLLHPSIPHSFSQHLSQASPSAVLGIHGIIVGVVSQDVV